MKLFKKIISLFALLGVLLSLCSCYNTSVDINTEQDYDGYIQGEDYQNFLDLYSAVAMTEDGYYYICNNLLYYCEKATLSSYPVCSKADCSHSDENCTAYISPADYLPLQLSYYNNSLYIMGWEIEQNDIHNNYIYQISLDNYKRKKVAYLNSSNGLSSVVFIIHRGYVYYVTGGSTMSENTAVLYRKELGDVSKNNDEAQIFEFGGYGAEIFALSAYGNNLFFDTASYEDSEGNGYKTSLNILNIHSLESKVLVDDNKYSYFANSGFVYYEKDKNTVYKIDLSKDEEAFFCSIDSPAYISADENYLYFDNQQAMYIDDSLTERTISAVDKETGETVLSLSPKNNDDECCFGSDDIMIFKGTDDNSNDYFYIADKTNFP